ncbi:hypothetical protein [Hymenobacter koreensis]|uniref:DUF4249 family protein n=1 Tax=Hymenobacter koreensis TaxID=1084523 RepID=A0ABP8IYY3_9BACT
MKQVLIVLMAVLLASCGIARRLKNKYYTMITPKLAAELLSQPGTVVDSVVLDQTFSLYVRQVCRPRPPAGYYASGRPDQPASVERCDCDDPTRPGELEKLEIQYLLVSAQRNRFVYLTTVPADVSQGSLRYDRPLFRVDNFVNLGSVNTFFIGRVSGGELQFNRLGGKPRPGVYPGPERWLFSLAPGGSVLTLDALAQEGPGYGKYSIPGRVLALAPRFFRKDAWRIGASLRFWAPTLEQANVSYLRNNVLYWVRATNEKVPDELIARFTQPFPGTKYTALFFHGERVMGLPVAPGR